MNNTSLNRYPDLFRLASTFFDPQDSIKILSFGCSTGEELLSLRDHFPAAQLYGVDINPWNLRLARKKCQNANVQLELPSQDYLEKAGPFEIIFCMAVLQSLEVANKNIHDITDFYPFTKFAAKLNELDSCLKPEGLMVIEHASFCFEDTVLFKNYEILDEGRIKEAAHFDRHNQRLKKSLRIHRVFRKLR